MGSGVPAGSGVAGCQKVIFIFFSPWFVVASFKYPSVSDKFLEAQRDRFQVPEGSRSGESRGILGFNQGSSSLKTCSGSRTDTLILCAWSKEVGGSRPPSAGL